MVNPNLSLIFFIFGLVKWFTGILSIYLLVLSFVPCMDNDDCKNEAIAYSRQVPAENDHKDLCTPFCICSCCHNIITLATIPTIELVELAFYGSRPYRRSIASPIMDREQEIFQPPKFIRYAA
jgi:hypothetical protein